MKKIVLAALLAAVVGVSFGAWRVASAQQAPLPSTHTLERIQVSYEGDVSITLSPALQGMSVCSISTSAEDTLVKLLIAAQLAGKPIEVVEAAVSEQLSICEVQVIALGS